MSTATKTTTVPVTLQRLKLRGTTERFASQLFGKQVTKTRALEALVIAGFVRGLSVRDLEATLIEALGPDATVSKPKNAPAEVKADYWAIFDIPDHIDPGWRGFTLTADGRRLLQDLRRSNLEPPKQLRRPDHTGAAANTAGAVA